MKCLIIKKSHLDNILSGKKTWEIRGSGCKFRGKIGLIESGSGTIVGEAVLVESIGPLSGSELVKSVRKHLIPKDAIRRGLRYKRPHAWVLSKAKRYRTPKPYRHKQGAVIWVTV